MPELVSKTPTLVSELFGASVGFRFVVRLRRACGMLLVGTALLLLVRRLSGAFLRPPSFGTALAVILTATVIAAVYRMLRRRESAAGSWRDCDTQLPPRLQQLLVWESAVHWYLPTAALAVIAAALSVPGTGVAALGALWLIVVGGEAAWFGSTFVGVVDRSEAGRIPPKTVELNLAENYTDAAAPAVESQGLEPSDDSLLSQSWRRYRDAAGCDVVEGFVRVSFPASGRQASIHLSFCPPFDRTPTLEAEPVDSIVSQEIDLELEPAVVLPYAARIDARLAEPAEEELVLKIGFRAVAEPGADSEPEVGPAGL